MTRRSTWWLAVMWVGAMSAPAPARAAEGLTPAVVVCPTGKQGSFAERLAAQEIRRYYYLRTGRLVPVAEDLEGQADGAAIVVGAKSRPVVTALLANPDLKREVAGLGPDQYAIRVVQHQGRPVVLVAGGDPTGALYGAYRLAEQMGVRFYMHGDVVPDKPIAPAIRIAAETGKPLFDRRGIQPFHDFPEGPDWWNVDAYKAILGQLPKMRMNFFGLHTYPEGGVGPEPVTWIGPPEDIAYDVIVKRSYPSRHFTTANGTWGYQAMKTGEYSFGAGAMYDRDDYGVDYMRGMAPWPKTPEAQSELFHRMGVVLKDSFRWGRRLGIKTCIGTETPLIIPTPVKERLKAAGKNPADPAVVQEIYEGMFKRIMSAHTLDYYWFWTPEGWTWEKVSQQQIDGTLADFRAAIAAAQKVKAPFTLATCGWVLGPPQQPALFDDFLPKDMPMSCISRQVGHSPVEPGFAKVTGRPKWAIPWMEDDPALTSVQLWAGRMRKDAADALAYGCTGLMGIHWRTRVLAPNVAALAAAAWDQKSFNPAFNKEIKLPKAPEGPLGGQFAQYGNPIADTEDDPLYQTVRYNTGGYLLDVPNGKYSVTLKLCEVAYDKPGVRVFGVKLQGKQVVEGLDLFAKAGKNKALDMTFKDVEVSDGRLAIEFTYEVELPSIAAIVVEGPATRKINCGGPAYKDFQADWPASPDGGRQRYLPVADFYADWCRAEFGPEVAEAGAAIFSKIDGHLPRPSDWVNGPGGTRPDPRPWETVRKDYAFVDELAALRGQVRGAGDLERFDYWLNNFRFMRSMAQVNCTWARFNAAMDQAVKEKDAARQKELARGGILPLRKELVAQVAELHRHLLATVTTPGEMGTVTNYQQHNMPEVIHKPGEQLAKLLGQELPADALPGKQYQGEPRLFMPVVRTALTLGEDLHLTAVVLGATAKEAVVCWRALGAGEFAKAPLEHAARGVYQLTLPREATQADLEYYVQVQTDQGATLRYPPTAPAMNQTVVVVKEEG